MKEFVEALKAQIAFEMRRYMGRERIESIIDQFAATWRPEQRAAQGVDTSPEAQQAVPQGWIDAVRDAAFDEEGYTLNPDLAEVHAAMLAVAAEKEAQALEYVSLFGQTQEALDRIAELESKLGAEQCKAVSMEALAVKRAEMLAAAPEAPLNYPGRRGEADAGNEGK